MSNSYGEITAFISDDCELNGHALAKSLNQYTWIQSFDFFSWHYDQGSKKLVNPIAINTTDPSLFPQKIIKLSVYNDEVEDYVSVDFKDLIATDPEKLDIEHSEYASLEVIINDLSSHIYSGFVQLNLKSENFNKGYAMLQQITIKPNNCGTRIHHFYDSDGESGPSVESVINGALI